MRRQYRYIAALLMLMLGIAGVPAVRAQQSDQVDTRIDVALVIDNSGSMQQSDPGNKRISAARMFASLMLQGDQLGIVSMEDFNTTKTYLSLVGAKSINAGNLDQLVTAPDTLSNWTYMGQALDLAGQVLENAAQYNRQRAVIFLTDGLPTYRDEHRAEQEAKFKASIQDFTKRGIKVFPIMLADGDKNDPEFLQREIATPTGGRMWRAENADQLINVFTDVLTTLQDGRYIDSYPIIANTEAFLANVNPRQQIRQVNFVFPALSTPPKIGQELIPGLLLTAQTSKIYDPNWSMFTAMTDYVDVQGEWRLNLQHEQQQVPMIAVIKSDLRARVLEPTPSIPDDEASVRYYPAGRPLLLRAGALNRGNLWEKGTGIFVQMREPEEWDGMTLVDQGDTTDVQPADGQYAGMYDRPLQPGTYKVMVNASPTQTHLLLKKDYVIVVEPLPTMQVTFEPDGQLQVNEPIRIKVNFALDGQPANVESAEIQAAVKREGKTIATVPLKQAGGNEWIGEYTPTRSEQLSFELTAHANWNSPERGPRRYTDFVRADYGAQQQPLVELNVPPVDERVNDLSKGIQRTVEFRSFSDKPVDLKLSVDGVPNADIYPATIRIEPREEGKRTVTIRSPVELPSGDAQVRLKIDGTENVRFNTTEIPINFAVRGFLERYGLTIAVLALVIYMVTRRKVREWIKEYFVRNAELLRYGGR